MHLPTPELLLDGTDQRGRDRRRWARALNLSLVGLLLVAAVYALQPYFDVGAWTVRPHDRAGLAGLLGAPLLHGSSAHLAANAMAIVLLGTLAGGLYPRATWRALPLLWVGPGLAAWWLGTSGSQHLGASGLTHGLMFLVLGLGLLRRDRPAVAAAMIALMFYGGMLLAILPREPDISWQMHLGGAIAGLVSAVIWRRADPLTPRKRYSWEDEADAQAAVVEDPLEPPSPHDVPVLWHRPPAVRGRVVRFVRRE